MERVVSTVDEIAAANGLYRQDCRNVGWLHDLAKEEPVSAFQDLLDQGEIRLDPETLEQPNLWHGFHAAYWGSTRFGISDADLLEAIRYHPTGSPEFSPTGLALIVADYCEPGRPLENTAGICEQAKTDLFGAALRVAREKVKFVLEKGKEPHSRSLAFVDWLEKQTAEVRN